MQKSTDPHVTHYLLTNREIDGNKIREDGKEPASELFRIAEYNPNTNDFRLIPDTAPGQQVTFKEKLDASTKLTDFTGSKRLFYDLYRTMSGEDGGDVLLYIHGFNNDLDAVRDAFKELIKNYVEPDDCSVKQIVVFSWPARNDAQYRDDRRDAKVSGYTLGRAVQKLGQFLEEFFSPQAKPLNKPCGNRLHIMCHSMGNFVFQSMIDELRAISWSRELFNQIILTAADVDYDVFEHTQSLATLPEYCKRATVYFNTEDKALFISATTKNPASRLGSNGPRVATIIPNNITIVDVSDAAPIGASWKEKVTGHGYHLNSAPVLKDMRAVLSGKKSEHIDAREYIQHRNIYRLSKVPTQK